MLTLLVSLSFAEDIAGPWEKGAYLDVALGGGAAYATWVEGDKLKYAAIGGTKVEDVTSGVLTGDAGGVRPDMVITPDGVPHIVYSTSRGVQRASRKGSGDWQLTSVSTGKAAGESLTAVTLDKAGGLVIAAIVRNGERSEVWVNGALAFDGATDGVCMCCKPALFTRTEGVILAFRDADGKRRDVRWLRMSAGSGWFDLGDATKGAWSPGGCPSDGPFLTDTTLLSSDARDGKRKIYEVTTRGERSYAPINPAAEMLQPRSLPDASLVSWVEATPGKQELVVRDGPNAPVVVATSTGRMEPGDPIAVGMDVWIPWQGETAHLVRWQSQGLPGM
jgi:hypothetical protein